MLINNLKQLIKMNFGKENAKKAFTSIIKVLSIIIAIALIILVIDSITFKQSLETAINYYEKGEYSKAYKTIKNHSSHSSNEKYKEIEYAYNYSTYLSIYEGQIEFMESINKAISTSEDALYNLLTGYKSCSNGISNSKDKIEIDVAENIKNIYLARLKNDFYIVEKVVDEIISLKDENYKNKIDEIISQNEKLDYDVQNPLKITLTSCRSDGAEGTITNISDFSINYAKIKVNFVDSNNKVIDTDWTYAISSEKLLPNETKKWSISVTKDFSIEECKVILLEFDK